MTTRFVSSFGLTVVFRPSNLFSSINVSTILCPILGSSIVDDYSYILRVTHLFNLWLICSPVRSTGEKDSRKREVLKFLRSYESSRAQGKDKSLRTFRQQPLHINIMTSEEIVQVNLFSGHVLFVGC